MYNKITLLGRAGKDVECKYLDSGMVVATFTLATSENRKNANGEWQEETTWHNVTLFGKKAEYVKDKVAKGALVFVEGKLQNRNYEKDGVKHYSSCVICDVFKIIPSHSRAHSCNDASEQSRYMADDKTQKPFDDDEIPF